MKAIEIGSKWKLNSSGKKLAPDQKNLLFQVERVEENIIYLRTEDGRTAHYTMDEFRKWLEPS